MKGCIERFVYKNECVYNNGLMDNLELGENVNIYKTNFNMLDSSNDNDFTNIINNFETEELYNNKFSSVINVEQFNRNNLRMLFKNASILKNKVKRDGLLDILKGKTVGLYFEEPSSRTYGSFA